MLSTFLSQAVMRSLEHGKDSKSMLNISVLNMCVKIKLENIKLHLMVTSITFYIINTVSVN